MLRSRIILLKTESVLKKLQQKFPVHFPETKFCGFTKKKKKNRPKIIPVKINLREIESPYGKKKIDFFFFN